MIRQVLPAELPVRVAAYMEPVFWAGAFGLRGELVGYACCSRLNGEVWLHDLKYEGCDPYDVARLMLFMRRALRERGVIRVTTDVSNPKLVRVYERMGFRRVSVMMQGEL